MRRVASALLAVVILAGCTWERTQRLGPIDPWPPRVRPARRPSLALRIYGIARFETAPSDVEVRELEAWRDAAVIAYRESGLFSSVDATWEPHDVIAEISISKSIGPVKPSVVAIVVPILYRQTGLVMRTRFRRSDGSLLRMVELSEDIRTLRYFLPPTRETEESLRTILYDLNRATLNKAAAQLLVAAADAP